MQHDTAGHALTTDSADAAEAIGAAATSFVGFRTDAMDHLAAATKADPGFALAHAARGLMLTTMRKPEVHRKAHECLAAAKAARTPETEREARYIAALDAMLAGKIADAAVHYEAITTAHPRDILALRLAQLELFWLGEMAWSRDISERAAPAWQPGDEGLAAFLAIRAFALEETGNYAEAERCGRAAIDLDPTESWGAHAVAHVLIMQARLGDGIAWCNGLSGNWDAANHIRHHNWWHLALFHIEARDTDAALTIYDERLRDLDSPLMKAVPDLYIDIQNDVALLERLALRGIDVGPRWGDVAELAAGRIGNHTNAFTSPHCTLALAAAGRLDEADETIRAMEAFIASDHGSLGPRYALAALPAARAAIAHKKGDHAAVIHHLEPARRNLWQMGGSHAQRDLFFQILANAAQKTGRKDLLATLMAEMGGLGLEHLEERSSYADALASLH